jgi:uncharacterized protein YnzC (UPF0291/DUF896 family)
MKTNQSHAKRRRAERQETMREYLSQRGKLDYVLDNLEKIETQGANMTPQELNALRIANDQRIKLMNKYLPDLKSMEISGDEDSPLTITKIERIIVKD